MATLLDDEFGDLAVELLDEFAERADGTLATRAWTHVDSIVDSPSTGTNTRSTTDYDVVTTPPMAFDPSAPKYREGDLTQEGAMYIALAGQGLAFTPSVGDTVDIDGKTWTVTGVQPVYAGEVVVLWSARVLA